ncbi:GNAT family N-acetyltransferase [Lapidilactobacillus luobeiensis]|uniref:GNAT family N-acetyltransferase n=1 Tax=Lapidilactobacillus luobeiensis TaxID=2950371 RepID=UPI0021C2E79B|nr:GNAT family N-acetyltransferase [Lapidilactobacillus luobeiensis]
MITVKSWPNGVSLWQVPAADAWTQLRPLLLLADEDARMVADYLPDCQLWALQWRHTFVASIALRPLTPTVGEIMNLAVAPDQQRQGVGRWLVQWALLQAQAADRQQVTVGTGDASLGNIRFYLQNGFRFSGVRPHFFDRYAAPIYEDGLRLQDMVLLTQTLTPAVLQNARLICQMAPNITAVADQL